MVVHTSAHRHTSKAFWREIIHWKDTDIIVRDRLFPAYDCISSKFLVSCLFLVKILEISYSTLDKQRICVNMQLKSSEKQLK